MIKGGEGAPERGKTDQIKDREVAGDNDQRQKGNIGEKRTVGLPD